ncbi:MAG TPA: T9SS type A sorting domain-containing protein [Bacteroidia bacterium]|jgi:PKD repeat protein|nr:T9SS type A sorting domain-containing protein [Bacteroidia bacterium]
MKQLITGLTLLFFACSVQAQNWKAHMADPSHNFYATQKEFYKDLKQVEKEMRRKNRGTESKAEKAEMEQEMPGYELFKRWENFMEPRVYPSGDVRQVTRAWEEYQKYMQQNQVQRTNPGTLSSTWMPVGPFGDPSGGNAGRVNAIRFDPSSSSSLWAATPDGGLWNSTNLGTHWSTLTDQLAVIGSSDVAFEPGNPQTMYLATGDGDAGDSYSMGVLKSTDGGATWNPTGLSWPVSQRSKIYKLLINPLNKNVLMAASTLGIYRTEDAGVTWALVASSGTGVSDIEYRPGDTTIVYAVSSDFYKSTDGGKTFSIITSGLPVNSAVDRLAIAVTPANPSYVYVVGSDANNDGFQGFYQSTDMGTTFTSKATSPNLLGWSAAGNDTGGQGWYTLSIAASPTDANEVVVGGVNIWRTTTAGTSWNIFGHWTGQGAPYVHADIHDLIYQSGSTIYAGTDGGVFSTSNSGNSWAAINGNMNIAEIYKIGMSKTNPTLIIAGHQDNGTNLYSGGWNQTMGGDGMACFIDWSNDKVMYGEQYSGSFNASTDGGVSWNGITTGLTGNGAWVTPWHQDPATANTIYGGYQQMFKSTNRGTNWAQIGTLPGTSSIVEFAIAPSNAQVMYVIQGKTLIKTINGGTAWTNVTGTLPVASARITDVAVKNNDPNTAWVTFSGYSSGNKVYVTRDGGATWTNFSTGLPNLPTNCIVYWNGTKEGMYAGCDVGIFYRDSTMSSWIAYNTGLPNVSVHDLEIFYPLGKIRAATFGRGLWEADLYNNGTLPPIASFVADKRQVCPGSTVNFTDQSTFVPTSWSWTFQGGTPATSNLQNPSVVYNTAGTYSVTLTSSNANGNNSMTKTVYIQVVATVALPLAQDFQNSTFPPANWINYDAANDNITWMRNATTGKGSNACMWYDNYDINATGTRDEFRTPIFNVSTANQKLYFDVAYAQYDNTYSDSLAVLITTDCWATSTTLYVKGGTSLATAPNVTNNIFVPTANQWRTDTVSLAPYIGLSSLMVAFQNRGHNGQAIYVDNINLTTVIAGVANLSDQGQLNIFPNPFTDKVRFDFGQSAEPKIISVFDILGKKISSVSVSGTSAEMDLSSLSAGIYLIQVKVKDGYITRKVMKQ